MTKTFAATAAAFAVFATLAIDTAPASAFSFGVERGGTQDIVSRPTGDNGGVSGLDLGSSR